MDGSKTDGMWFLLQKTPPFMGNLIVQTCGLNSVCSGTNPIGQPNRHICTRPGGFHSFQVCSDWRLKMSTWREDRRSAYKSRSRRIPTMIDPRSARGRGHVRSSAVNTPLVAISKILCCDKPTYGVHASSVATGDLV